MGLDLSYQKGQTPIDEEEKDNLLIQTISTRAELDELEQSNITNAIDWSMRRKFPPEEILSICFIKDLHYRMFSDVWNWAGTFRRSNKNLGVDKYFIEQELVKLVEDCRFWTDNRIYSSDEIAVRAKHRMVSIHPFPNGNGRHSRIYADILVSQIFNRPVFSWGGRNLSLGKEARISYLKALQQADQGIIETLLIFARS